jgi:hypothetical protein
VPTALDSRFTSFVQFLDAADLTQAVFEGHHNPLTLRTRPASAGAR